MDESSILYLILGIGIGSYLLINMYMLTKDKHLDKNGKGRKLFIFGAITSYAIAAIKALPIMLLLF